jgi:hypothetical protein
VCLTVAATNLISGCGSTTRRASIWTNGCFVAYADTDASSGSEDAFLHQKDHEFGLAYLFGKMIKRFLHHDKSPVGWFNFVI